MLESAHNEPRRPSLGSACAGGPGSGLRHWLPTGAQSLGQAALVQGASVQHHQRGQEEVGTTFSPERGIHSCWYHLK